MIFDIVFTIDKICKLIVHCRMSIEHNENKLLTLQTLEGLFEI